MKKILIYCFDKWWRPLIFFGFTTVLAGICMALQKQTLIDYSSVLLVIGLLGLSISTVYQLTKKKWLFAFLTTLTFGLGVIVFFLLAVVYFSIIQSTPDTFAESLKIPANIEIYELKGNGWDDYNTTCN